MKILYLQISTLLILFQIFGTSSLNAESEWKTYINTSQVNEIIVDGEYLWGATNGGVLRWTISDMTYKKFTTDDGLANNNVNTLVVEENGVVWVGNGQGVSRFDGNKWESVIIDNGTPGSVVLSLAVQKTILWIGTDAGVTRYDGEHWKTYTIEDGLLSNTVTAISVDTEEIVWVGTMGGGVSCYKNGEWISYLPSEHLPDSNVSALTACHDGSLWIATFEIQPQTYYKVPHIIRYANGEWTIVATVDELGYGAVSTLCMDFQGTMWAGTTSVLYRYEGSQWNPVLKDEAIGYKVHSVVTNELEEVWVALVKRDGHYNYGELHRYSNNHYEPYLVLDGPPKNSVESLALDLDGRLWAGFDIAGPAVFDGSSWIDYSRNIAVDGYKQYSVSSIAVGPNGSIWAGTWGGGLCMYNGSQWLRITETWETYEYDENLPYYNINSIAVDTKGVVWVGTKVGVSKFDQGLWTTFKTVDGLPDTSITSVVVDQNGNAWAGTWGYGIAQYHNGSWVAHTLRGGETSQNKVSTMTIGPNGDLWVGTFGGLFKYNDEGWVVYTEKDGLFDNRISAVAESPNGDIWTASSHNFGVCRLREGSWKTFTQDDGLVSDIVYSIVIGKDGTVWIGTGSGISRYIPDTDTFTSETKANPTHFLIGNYPNPFNLSTTIAYTLPLDGHVILSIYNVSGQRVSVLKDEYQPAGNYTEVWNAKGLPSGLYFCILQANGFTQTRKMVLVK